MTTTKKLNLLDDDEEVVDFGFKSSKNRKQAASNDSNGLTINASYAARYEDRMRKQELSQLEDKYKAQLKKKGITSKGQEGGFDDEDFEDDEEDSESDEEEDDEGEMLTPAVDAQILKTLSEIRARSEKVYDPSVKFFDESEIAKIDEEWRKKHSGSDKPKKKKDSKPAFTIRDFQREKILSGKALEEAQAEEDEEEFEEPHQLTHVEEQERLKSEMKKAFNMDGGEEDSDDDEEAAATAADNGLLSIRVKSEEEIVREEEEYRNFLLENLASSENAKASMGEWLNYREEHDGVSRKDGKSRKQLNDDDFLIDYVLNKGWVDKEATRIPSYDKIIEADLEDEEAEEQAEDFELSHNFRYEQEGGTQIQTFSRNIEGSMRREESSRKDQRKAAKERKALAKLQKSEELKRLKNLKMAEIKKRLEKITKTAPEEAELEDLVDDLEGDFDAEKHERLMQKIIKDDSIDGEEEDEEDKPVFSSDSEIDYTSAEEESKPAIKKARKAIKKVLKKPADEEGEKARLSKYLDELYTLDYEDLIGGDIPCRFKYQKVEPTTFGLTMDEILSADDKQLNTFFSLKKMAPYRDSERHAYDVKKYTSKKRLYKFRQDLRDAMYNNNKKGKAGAGEEGSSKDKNPSKKHH